MSLFYVIIIPVAIHLKCVYFDKSSGYVHCEYDDNRKIVQNACECEIVYPSKEVKYFEFGWIIITVCVGLYVTFYTFWNLLFGKEGTL